MKPVTVEWARKAEGDFNSAKRELNARKDPNYDSACFHAQQCAEKYLKACLQEAEIPFIKTHNLLTLLDLLPTAESFWELMRSPCDELNAFSVNFRYPGDYADKNEAKKAVAHCTIILERAKKSLGLDLMGNALKP